MNKLRQMPTRTTEPVLVALSSDGFCQVYGSKNVSVLIINRPHVISARAGNIVDDLLDQILPIQFQQIFYPSAIRATGQVTRMTAQRLERILFDLQFVESFRDPKLRSKTRQLLLRAIGGGR